MAGPSQLKNVAFSGGSDYYKLCPTNGQNYPKRAQNSFQVFFLLRLGQNDSHEDHNTARDHLKILVILTIKLFHFFQDNIYFICIEAVREPSIDS